MYVHDTQTQHTSTHVPTLTHTNSHTYKKGTHTNRRDKQTQTHKHTHTPIFSGVASSCSFADDCTVVFLAILICWDTIEKLVGDCYDVKQFVIRFIPLLMLETFVLLRTDSNLDFACTRGCPFQLSGDLSKHQHFWAKNI